MAPDFKIARELCLLADLAYDAIRQDRDNPPGSYCIDNYAFIIRDRGEYVDLAFQGTNDKGDALRDAQAIFEIPNEVQGWPPVHRGFWRAMYTCAPTFAPLIPHGKPLYIGGHSLAGAMAKKAAGYLSQRGHKVAGVYTWGCPNGGGVQWANWYNGLGIPTFDFIRGRDPIPFLPPYGVPTGKQIFLDKRDRIIPERMPLNWYNIGSRIPGLRVYAQIGWHAADGYLAAMDKLAA